MKSSSLRAAKRGISTLQHRKKRVFNAEPKRAFLRLTPNHPQRWAKIVLPEARI